MEDGEYELVASEEVDRLKKEIEHLKSNPFIQNSSDDKLYEAVRTLNESVTKLYTLFENVNKQLLKEYQSGESPEKKIDMLLEQNRNIAEALLALASRNEQANTNESYSPVSSHEEVPMPAMQQPLQMQSQIPPNPFMDAPEVPQQINRQNSPQQVSPQNQFQQMNLQPSQQYQQTRFNQMPQQSNNQLNQQNQFAQQSQMQIPVAPIVPSQKFGFKIDPNYPTPDSFPGLDSPPSFGEPINIEPAKKKGFLGLRKK